MNNVGHDIGLEIHNLQNRSDIEIEVNVNGDLKTRTVVRMIIVVDALLNIRRQIIDQIKSDVKM